MIVLLFHSISWNKCIIHYSSCATPFYYLSYLSVGTVMGNVILTVWRIYHTGSKVIEHNLQEIRRATCSGSICATRLNNNNAEIRMFRIFHVDVISSQLCLNELNSMWFVSFLFFFLMNTAVCETVIINGNVMYENYKYSFILQVKNVFAFFLQLPYWRYFVWRQRLYLNEKYIFFKCICFVSVPVLPIFSAVSS